MRVVSLGDLVLDVVVRVHADVARGADTPATVVLSAGGQGANVAAWVAALGGDARWLGKRAADAAGTARGRAARGARRRARRAGRGRPATASSSRSSIATATGRCSPTEASRRASSPTSSARVARCDHLHVSGYALLARARRERCAARRRAGARGWRAGQRRPVVLEHDPRRRPGAIPGPRRVAEPGRRVRERGRGGGVRRAARRASRGSSSVERAAARSTATSAPRSPVGGGRRHDGRGRCARGGLDPRRPELALEAAARCVQRMGSMP